MRVALVGDEFPPDIGGASTYAAGLSKALADLGVDVTMITHRRHRSFGYSPPGVKIRYLGGPCIPVVKRSFPLGLLKELTNLLEGSNFQVIHGTDLHSTMALYAVRIASKLKLPCVITCHSVRDSIGKWMPIYRLFIKRFIKRPDRIIAVSPETRDLYISLGAPQEKIRVVLNGVDLSLFRPANKREIRRTKEMLGFPDSRIIFTAIRLTKRKGPIDLVRAFSLITREAPDARLVIAGWGKDAPRVLSEINRLKLNGRVRLVGRIPHRDVARFLAASDVYVLPSLQEACPIGLLEAMSTHVPVVATATTGALKIVRDGFNGIIVPIGDPQSLAYAVLSVLRDRRMARRLASKGSRTARMYGWDRTARQTLQIYREISGTVR